MAPGYDPQGRFGAVGGIAQLPVIREAAAICIAGLDPMRFMESEDMNEIMTMQAIAHAVADLHAEANKS